MRGQLAIHYQPIVALATGRIASVESLVRWEHPESGVIPPAEFVPIAERSGLIVQIDRWVLRQSCARVLSWQRQFPRRPRLVASVNLSAKLIHRAGLIDDIHETLRATGLDAGSLRLEVTESVLMQDSIANIGRLHALRQLGVGIAIDDFGTGYSSLSYLRWLPADILKLDRSFIARLDRDPRDAVIVGGLLEIARGLGMRVTAEGIETEQQWSQLRRLGCADGQGFYFSRPLPADEMTALLQREADHASPSGLDIWGGAPSPRRPRVLVVDDDEHIRQLVGYALELEGYEVIAASHGQAALDSLERLSPSLILLDIMMPVMDGRQFSREYHRRPGPHAPIVVLTASSKAAGCAAEVGAADYLAKPFDIHSLLKSVDKLAVATPA